MTSINTGTGVVISMFVLFHETIVSHNLIKQEVVMAWLNIFESSQLKG